MALADHCARRDADDDVGELLAPRLAHPQPPQLHRGLERSDRPRGDFLRLGGDSVHQHVDVPADQPRSRRQNEHGNEECRRGVRLVPAGPHEEQTSEHRDGAGQVAREMDGIRLQRGRAVAPSRPHRDDRSAQVDADHDRQREQRVPLDVHRGLRQPGEMRDRAPTDDEGRTDEQRRLTESGEMLGLSVPVRMTRVRGAAGDADREEGEKRRDEVGARVRGL